MPRSRHAAGLAGVGVLAAFRCHSVLHHGALPDVRRGDDPGAAGAAGVRGGRPQQGSGSLLDLLRAPFLNHRVEVVRGVLADEVGEVLRQFFSGLRAGDQ